MPRTYHVAGREYVSAEADAEWLAARQAEEATRIPPPTERHIAAGRKSAAVRAAQEQRG
jgi:hypothetical protein